MPIQKAYLPQWSPFSHILLEYSFSWELATVEFGSSLWSPITQCGGKHWEEVSGCCGSPLGLISEVHGFQGNADQKPNALHCLAQLDVQPNVGFFQINKWEYLIVCKPFHRINPAPLAAKLWALTVIGNILKNGNRTLEEFKNNGHYTKWQREEKDACLGKGLFCYQWTIQEYKQTWVWAREKLPNEGHALRRGVENPRDTTVPSSCLSRFKEPIVYTPQSQEGD